MNTIYTIGGGAILEQLLNAVAVILSGSKFAQIAKVTAMTGLLWMIITSTLNQDWIKNGKWFLVMAVSYNVMLLPKVEVNIVDRLEPAVPRVVDNVPFVLASFASFSSSIGNAITELFDEAMSLPDDVRYNKSGFLMGAELLDSVGRITITDPTLKNNVEAFMVRCVQRDIQLGKFTMKEIMGSKNIFTFLKTKGLTNLRSVTFLEDRSGGGYNPQLYTCQEAFNKIVIALNVDEKPRIMNKLASTMFGSRVGSVFSEGDGSAYQSALLAMLPASYDYFMKQSDSAVNIINHHLLLSALYDGVEAQNPDYPSVRARLQANQTYQATGKMAKEFLPFIRITLEVILYGMFPVIVLLMLLPSAAMILANYIQAIVWVQSWGPVYAVIHFMSTFLLRSSLSSNANDGYNGYNVIVVHDVIANANAIASYMTMFVPFISWMILKGFQNLVHMGSSLLQPAISSASAAASEVTTGNFAMGNVSMRNISHDTYGAWKYNHGFDIGTGSSAQRSDMMVERFGSDGTHTYDDSAAMSRMKFRISDSYSENQQYSTASAFAKRMANDEMQSSVNSYASGFSKMMESRNFKDHSEASGSNFEEQSQSLHEKALTKIDQAAQEFAQSHKMNKETVTGLMLSGTLGSPDQKPLSGKVSINGEYRALSSDEISDLQRVTSSKEIQDALRINESSIQSDSFNLRDDKGNSISDSVRADFNQGRTLSHAAEKHLSQSQEFTKRAEDSRSSGLNVERDLTQDLIEYTRGKYGSHRIDDHEFMAMVAKDQEFKDSYHYKSALSQINSDGNLPNSMKDIRQNFSSGKDMSANITNDYNSFRPVAFEHHSSSMKDMSRQAVDNSHLVRDTDDTISGTEREIGGANVANDRFESDVRRMAERESSFDVSLDIFNKNRSHTDVFDKED